jgi:folate-binding protein YgfZ
MTFTQAHWADIGDLYCVHHPRGQNAAYDLFVPREGLASVAEKLRAQAGLLGGGLCGWRAWELARVESGLPRFGVDMDESNLAPETGIEGRAISYSKGCYIGQEVIARIRTYGQVAKSLCGLRLGNDASRLPRRGEKLFRGGNEVGYITSAVESPRWGGRLALGFIRREHRAVGTELTVVSPDGTPTAIVVALPFREG